MIANRSETLPAGRELVQVESLSHAYGSGAGARLVLSDVRFSVVQGEFICIVGPSGAGKTTLLRCLAGLQQPTSGRAVFDGREVDRPPSQLAVVFQDYSRSLMPWLSVFDNVALPLRSAGLGKEAQQERSLQALGEVGLADVSKAYPWQLSGGMQQRVAIARALAYRPAAVLMDEPFASVDAQTRADLEDLVLKVREHLGLTLLLVTHDIDEAVYLADRVVVLSGSPASVARIVDVPFGSARDQLLTKATREFAELRREVHEMIRRPAGAAK
ncbi:MAG: ABC transporter ATP-binding protein [Deltaproteobacteria bacterium]|nr:ABC transporter ATP-binding protein [Deltaproteobacteria bacterium]